VPLTLPLAHVEQGERVAVGVASTPSFGAPSAVPIAAARVERGGAEHVGNVRCRGDAELGAERVHLAPSRDQAGVLGAHGNHGHAGVGNRRERS
jgi:hypothetical protein